MNVVGKGIFFVSVGALAAAAITANYKTICAQVSHVCTDERTRSVLAEPFPNYYNDRTEDSSASKLGTRMKKSIASLNITEDMWQNRGAFESIKKIC